MRTILPLPIELTNSNDGRGNHWGRTASRRQKYERLIRQLICPLRPFSEPVRIEVVRVLGKRQSLWDYSSCGRGNWKEIEDALVAVGLLKDDGPKHVTGVEFLQDASRRSDGPSIDVVFIWSE